ncbi:recombinase family protein [Pseudoalteromonas sp. MB41]|uniref:recombinase family protein n=1 Tax=Pseudoalteromonas sp. MB41 TaxID=2896366 RepID=UPI001E3001E1|nr:recombinase family protein [Pseudoalteromonas sp. MB41]MCC9661465.1 recombinase family protein [Pseudoalteromonas sp. MB41]
MSKIGFARVSTIEQDLTIQLNALKVAGCEEIFSGKQSGASDENEAKLSELLNYIRKGDVIIVTKLDRLGRSLKSVLSIIEAIHQKKATLKTLDGVIDTSNESPFAKATVNLIGTFAQLERDLIVSRTQEGREAAKRAGKHLGRPATIPEADRKKIRKLIVNKECTVSELARRYSVTRTTINRIRDEK